MANSSVFVGMVTHARSRFNVGGAASILTQALVDRLRAEGVLARFLVSDRDDYDPSAVPMSRSTLLRSAVHQAALEHRWRRYLADGGAVSRPAATDALYGLGMAGKRGITSLGPRPWMSAGSLPGSAAAIRLLNIDLSHLRVMEAALRSGSEWAVILEDDAGIADPTLAARQIAWLISGLAGTSVAFASLSESLPIDQLGVGALLGPAADIVVPDGLGFTLSRASRPVTNTVCATLYRSEYLAELRSSILRRGLTPIAPIDWRVNEAIMDMFGAGALDGRSCVWTRPGIVLQRSMRA